MKLRYPLSRFLLFLLFLLLVIAGAFFWKSYRTSLIGKNSYQPLPLPSSSFLTGGTSAAASFSNQTLQILDGEFTHLVAQVVPSVVSITTTDRSNREALLREFFGLSHASLPSPNTMGSGIIVSAEGEIITNWHVINNAFEITIQLNDGRTLPAKLIGFDKRADIALLKIEADHLTPIALADSDRVKVGQRVWAIGNPFGLQETVTEGIISAKGRRATSESVNEFFQTSALINPGNSGGPLVNIDGAVIGINNFVLSSSSGAVGLGFAIPSNVARRVYNDIMKYGYVVRPWFGVVLRPLNTPLARQLGLTNTTGALIAATLHGSPAEQAGIRPGDVITTFNNQPIKNWSDLRRCVAQTEVGAIIPLTIQRNGLPYSLQTKIQEEPK